MKYEAITIDTSVVEQFGLRLEAGMLAQLRQLRDGPVQFVLTEVVFREIKKHLCENATKIHSSFRATALKAIECGLVRSDASSKLIEMLDELPDPALLSERRLNDFVTSTGAEVLDTSIASLPEVVSRYFASLPPFEPIAPKKNEFPDAIALLSLEAWAADTYSRVLAVSKDIGWAKYAEQSQRIDAIDDLGAALQLLQGHLEQALRIMDRALREIDSRGRLATQFQDELVESIQRVQFLSFARGNLHVRSAGLNVGYNDYSFHSRAPHFGVTIVHHDETEVTARVPIDLSLIAFGTFEFYASDPINPDAVSVGETIASKEFKLEVSVLLSVKGDVSEDSWNVEVDYLELIDMPDFIDFGFVEPDRGE